MRPSVDDQAKAGDAAGAGEFVITDLCVQL